MKQWEADLGAASGSYWGSARKQNQGSQILAVLSDPVQAGLVAQHLHAAGLVPTLAFTNEQAISCLTSQSFEVVLFDQTLNRKGSPRVSSIARASGVPMVTVQAASADSEAGLPIEDYVSEDSDLGEVVGRCAALVQISRPVHLPSPLRWGPLELDQRRRVSSWRNKPLKLTTIQFRILEVLICAGGALVTTVELTRRVWGSQSFDDGERILAHIRRIRKKIEHDSSRPKFLLTVRGEGYRLADSEMRPDIDSA